PLTSTVLAAVPAEHAGMASAVNNDVARTASLIAVAVLPAAAGLSGSAYLHAARFSAGFHTASLISAGLCLIGGAVAAATIRNPDPADPPPPAPPAQTSHCGLDGPPSRTIAAAAGVADGSTDHAGLGVVAGVRSTCHGTPLAVTVKITPGGPGSGRIV